MKKTIYRLFGVFALLLFSLGVFTGCTPASTVNTVISVNEDLSGVRTMDVLVKGSVLSQQFSGTIEDINALVEAECPEGLTWTYESAGEDYRYVFELQFASVEDYSEKVHKILTGEEMEESDEPWVEIQADRSPFKDYFYIEEDFTSVDLLQWMIDALLEKEYVTEQNSAYVFKGGDNLIRYGEKEFSTYEYAYAEEQSYVEYYGISIYTTVNEDESYDRSIVFAVPKESMETGEAEKKAYLESLVPEGATFTWEEVEQPASFTTSANVPQILFTVEKTEMSLEELNAFNKAYFGSEKCQFTASRVGTDSPFSWTKMFVEEIDFSRYYEQGMSFLPQVHYYIKSEDGYAMAGSGDTYEAEDFSNISQSKKYTISGNRTFYVGNIDVETKIMGKDRFEREIRLTFDKAATEQDLNSILQNIKEQFGGEEDYQETYNVEITGENESDTLVLVIKQKGSAEEFFESDLALFGKSTLMSYGVDYKPLRLRNTFSFYMAIDWDGIIRYRTDELSISYKVTGAPGTNIKYCPDENYDVHGRKANVEGTWHEVMYSVASTNIAGVQWNLWAIVFWVLLLVAFAGAILWSYKYGYLTKGIEFAKTRFKEIREENRKTTDDFKEEETLDRNSLLKTETMTTNIPQPIKDSADTEDVSTEQEEPWIAVIEESALEELDIEIDVEKKK